MRSLIEQQSFNPPRPPCKMPSLSSVFQKAMEMKGGGNVYATTIDASKFYWSLVMPERFWNKFRLLGSFYKTLPFGWDFALVIAHEPLRFLLAEIFKDFAPHVVANFQYLDDIILFSTNPEVPWVLPHALCNFLKAKGLVISKKSCTEPSQTVCWIGKKFNLGDMSVENLPSTTLKSVAAAVWAAVQPLTPKCIERITRRVH